MRTMSDYAKNNSNEAFSEVQFVHEQERAIISKTVAIVAVNEILRLLKLDY